MNGTGQQLEINKRVPPDQRFGESFTDERKGELHLEEILIGTYSLKPNSNHPQSNLINGLIF